MGGAQAVAALLCLAALAGCIGGSERDFEPIPEAGWRPGYTFEYTVQSHHEVTGSVLVNGVDDSDNLDVGERGDFGPAVVATYTVFDAGAQVGGIPVYLAISKVGSREAEFQARTTFSGPGEDLHVVPFQKADLQPLRVGSQASGRDGAITGAKLTDGGQRDYSLVRFPLARGDTWTTADTRGFTGFRGAQIVSTVGGMRTVPGPTGDVDAIHVHHEVQVDDVKEATIRQLKEEGFRVERFDLEATMQRDVDYAPSLHNVVRDVTRMTARFQADFTARGNHTVLDVTEDATNTLTLTALSLLEGPPHTLEDALSGLVPVLPLGVGLPGGTTAPPGSGPTLRVAPATAKVNVADPERRTVAFATKVTGAASSLEHRVTNRASGARLASGPGGDFLQDFLDAGTYDVTVAGATPEGRYVEGTAVVYADYDVERPAACGSVALEGVGACPSETVPVRVGVGTVTVFVARTAVAGEPGVGRLELVDPDGKVYSAPLGNNVATITLHAGLVPGDWTATYRPTFGLQESVTYGIHVGHGRS